MVCELYLKKLLFLKEFFENPQMGGTERRAEEWGKKGLTGKVLGWERWA